MRKYTPEKIDSLSPGQVFVFGSNVTGFHGAGAAGLAWRGEAANTWRQDPAFLAAMKAPVGSPERVGRWAVYGVARGPQAGRVGQSYAIVTIEIPGQRRSTPLSTIEAELTRLCQHARAHPQQEFLVTKIGCGLAGYTAAEIAPLFSRTQQAVGIPDNVVLPAEFECRA